MFRHLKLVAPMLVAAAIAAPIVQAKPVDPLAISVLGARGLSASQIYDWTQGVCSYQVKPASCYLTPTQARLASQRLAQSMGGPRPTTARLFGVPSSTPVPIVEPGSFHWGDALIGAAVMAGIFLLGKAGALTRLRRRELTHP